MTRDEMTHRIKNKKTFPPRGGAPPPPNPPSLPREWRGWSGGRAGSNGAAPSLSGRLGSRGRTYKNVKIAMERNQLHTKLPRKKDVEHPRSSDEIPRKNDKHQRVSDSVVQQNK